MANNGRNIQPRAVKYTTNSCEIELMDLIEEHTESPIMANQPSTSSRNSVSSSVNIKQCRDVAIQVDPDSEMIGIQRAGDYMFYMFVYVFLINVALFYIIFHNIYFQ